MAKSAQQGNKIEAKPLVMKFGGTSVGSAEAIQQACQIISSEYKPDGRLLVVASAMSGITNRLIACAKYSAEGDEQSYQDSVSDIRKRHSETIQALPIEESARTALFTEIEDLIALLEKYCTSVLTLGEITPRTLDAIESLGERMNIRQVSALLTAMNIPNRPVDADQIIVTDQAYQNAHPLLNKTCQRCAEVLIPLLEDGIVPIITGFIGATEKGVTTTLGRGGSDYTAALLGACLDAREVWTWTDVDGVMTADPNIVPDARVIERLSFDEVSEMAYFGAKVLHPKTMRPLVEKDIPLWVKNTFNPTYPGTRISSEEQVRSGKISCVTTIRDVCLLTVQGKGMLGVPGVAARTFSAVARENASVLMISQSSSEQSICFVIPESDREKVERSLREELAYELVRGDVDSVQALGDIVIITAIGAAMRYTPGVSASVFTALGTANINVLAIAQGSSEYSLSMVLSKDEADAAVREIHKEVIINGNK